MNNNNNNRNQAFAAYRLIGGRAALAAARVNFKNAKPAVVTTAVVAAAMLAQTIVMSVIAAGDPSMRGSWDISFGNFLYLLPVLCAIVFASRNFRKFMHLGGNRDLFFRGCLIGYVLLAAAVSFANCVIHAVYDPVVLDFGFFERSVNLLDVFGWGAHGAGVAFLRQCAFLFFAAAFAHTLSALQGSLAGWIADGALVAVICVFTPIAPLRAAEAAFFELVLFTPNALLHIVACLALGAAAYMASRPILNRKAI